MAVVTVALLSPTYFLLFFPFFSFYFFPIGFVFSSSRSAPFLLLLSHFCHSLRARFLILEAWNLGERSPRAICVRASLPPRLLGRCSSDGRRTARGVFDAPCRGIHLLFVSDVEAAAAPTLALLWTEAEGAGGLMLLQASDIAPVKSFFNFLIATFSTIFDFFTNT